MSSYDHAERSTAEDRPWADDPQLRWLAAALRTYVPDEAPTPSPALLALFQTGGAHPLRPALASSPARGRRAAILAFTGTAAGKIVLGATVAAAASLGGLQATGTIHLDKVVSSITPADDGGSDDGGSDDDGGGDDRDLPGSDAGGGGIADVVGTPAHTVPPARPDTPPSTVPPARPATPPSTVPPARNHNPPDTVPKGPGDTPAATVPTGDTPASTVPDGPPDTTGRPPAPPSTVPSPPPGGGSTNHLSDEARPGNE